MIKLKSIMKEIINDLEENDILMDIDCLDGREKKIKIPSFGQL